MRNAVQLTKDTSDHNFKMFIWHGFFMSLAISFTDMQTIIPSLLIKAGANSILLGLLTAIMIGGSQLMQIVFSNVISAKPSKKNPLIFGINLRILSLFVLGVILLNSQGVSNLTMILLIFILMTIFSFSGSYAAIPYVDLTGKIILSSDRKSFFSLKQIFSSVGILISAILAKHILKSVQPPDNYGILFLIASSLLFVASLGFWKIKETVLKITIKHSFLEYFAAIPYEISENKNLKNYIFLINFLGLGMSFIPFMIIYAKKNFGLSNNLIGNFLLYKVTGTLIASLILYKRSKKFQYKRLLYLSMFLGIILPILCLIFNNNIFIYQLIFILSGVFLTTYSIARSGILIEISNNLNRSKFAGISGAGNILPTIFPLISGILISFLGFHITFITISILILFSIFSIRRLNCNKK